MLRLTHFLVMLQIAIFAMVLASCAQQPPPTRTAVLMTGDASLLEVYNVVDDCAQMTFQFGSDRRPWRSKWVQLSHEQLNQFWSKVAETRHWNPSYEVGRDKMLNQTAHNGWQLDVMIDSARWKSQGSAAYPANTSVAQSSHVESCRFMNVANAFEKAVNREAQVKKLNRWK